MGSFYKSLRDVLSNAFKNRDKTVILVWNCNARGINWESQMMSDNYDNPGMCEDLMVFCNYRRKLQGF